MTATIQPTEFPGPQTRPGLPVVLFDGHCRFCTTQVDRLHRWDKSGRLAYLSLHDPSVPERYPDLSHEQLMEEMHVVTPAGENLRGIESWRYLSRLLPRLWPIAVLLHIPLTGPLWRLIYRLVARYRYLIAGRTANCDGDACAVHLRGKRSS